jgi:hypothetical protein
MLIQQNPHKIEEQLQQLRKCVLFFEEAIPFYPIILLRNTIHSSSLPVLTIPVEAYPPPTELRLPPRPIAKDVK